jgi:predicted permease
MRNSAVIDNCKSYIDTLLKELEEGNAIQLKILIMGFLATLGISLFYMFILFFLTKSKDKLKDKPGKESQ